MRRLMPTSHFAASLWASTSPSPTWRAGASSRVCPLVSGSAAWAQTCWHTFCRGEMDAVPCLSHAESSHDAAAAAAALASCKTCHMLVQPSGSAHRLRLHLRGSRTWLSSAARRHAGVGQAEEDRQVPTRRKMARVHRHPNAHAGCGPAVRHQAQASCTGQGSCGLGLHCCYCWR